MQTSAKKVSAIIPTNNSTYLQSTVDSIVNHVDEILIINSGKAAIELTSNEKVEVIQFEQGSKNASEARNFGAKKAKNEILLFIDSDVEINESGAKFLENCINNMSNSEIFSGFYVTDKKQSLISNIFTLLLRYRRNNLNQNKTIKLTSSSHFLIHKSFFLTIGGFNENLKTYEDVDFFGRAQVVFNAKTINEEKFTAIHNKKYNFLNFFTETLTRTFDFAITRLNFSSFFKNIPSNFDWRINFIPLTFLAFIIGCVFFMEKKILLFGVPIILLIIGSLITKEIFKTYITSIFANIIISIVGFFSWLSAILALAVFGFRSVGKFFLKLKNLTTCLMRAIFKYGKPIQLIQYVTSRCNLRCDHCFYKETLDKKDPGELPPEVIINSARQFGPLLWYSLAGGEPFIRSDFSKIVTGVKKTANPVIISLPTNGWYTERTYLSCLKILQEFEDGLFILFFSIDGDQAIHDNIRGENSYNKLKETFELLRKLSKLYNRLHLNLIITVQEQNHQCFPKLIDNLFNEFEPTSISINLFRHHDLNGPKIKPEIISGYEKAVEAYDKIRNRKSYGILSSSILKAKEKIQKDLILTVAKKDKFVTPCTAGNLSYVTMEDGSVKPCEILKDTMGSISTPEKGLKDIFFSKKSKDLRKRIKDTKCKCTYECAMTTNVLFNKNMFPSIIKQSVKDSLKS